MSQVVGRSLGRVDGPAKVTGQARYIDDLAFDDVIFGATLRSDVACGKILSVELNQAVDWNSYVIISAKDLPQNPNLPMIERDQPVLARDQIRHAHEPILLLGHRDRTLLNLALRNIRVNVKSANPLLDMDESASASRIVWGNDNCFKSVLINKGSVNDIWSRADHVVEGIYRTEAQEQLYIEPNGVVAKWEGQSKLTLWGSMQCPYYVHKALVTYFGLAPNDVRVVQAETGGGFGGKEDYPSMIACHAALLARKSGHTVKMIYDRSEDMAATTKRHPSVTRHKTAVSRGGKILAMEIDATMDGGAYCTLSPVVISRGAIHAAGPYSCDHVRVRARAVATNTPPNGAFRGFGAPQTIFALERHLDRVAREIGLDPAELRRRNFLKTGDTTATEQVIHERMRLNEILDLALAKSDYVRKRRFFDEENKNSRWLKRGIGLATFMHGAGFTGSGENLLASIAAVEITGHGQVRVLASSTEIGQGERTVFTQIVADALGVDPAAIEIVQPDTSLVPDSGPTVASRTTMVVGKLLERCAHELKAKLVEAGLPVSWASFRDFKAASAAFCARFGLLRSEARYVPPPHVTWDDSTYTGSAYGTFAWAAYVASVCVDLRTYQITVEDFVAVQEVGKVVNPVLASGQIEGGVAQAIGYALTEKVIYEQGRVINNQMTNYIIPTCKDLPRIRVHFLEQPYAHGPSGAKGIGELPMDGPAPAILNAIDHATGISLTKIPVLPEDLMAAAERAPR